MQIHQYTEGLYDKCLERFDEVGEILKMRGNFPPVKMSDYAVNATIVELDSQELTVPEVLNIIKEDIAVMKALAEKIREEASEADDFVVVATFEDYIKGYVKDLWFLDAMMKS